ncbi:MAG: hypothetical protein LBH43_08130 [Treponema sp.]|jgi:hypothetical protein|nr:hypothetical protein [Treponema sp.]
MLVNGCDCSIVIKTAHRETDIPFSDETLREAVSILQEEASIEGDGVSRGIRKIIGVTGCVVSPLTITTAPLLLYLAIGAAGLPLFISETRNLFRYELNLLPMEDTEHFDLIHDRSGNNEQLTGNNERKLYENCHVQSFEFRVLRGEAVKLKLDICGECAPRAYPYTDTFDKESGERFSGDYVTYQINSQEYTNIYGITLVSKKISGTKTELWIKRALQQGSPPNGGGDIPAVIDEIIIMAHLLRDKYEVNRFGMFRITLKRLVLISDETEVNTADTVIGPLRYYVLGGICAEVFSNGGGCLE